MRTINLSMKKNSKIPLEFDEVLPTKLYNKTLSEIKNTTIYHGNSTTKLQNYFTIKIEGDCNNPQHCTIIINGNLKRVKYIGYKMTEGTIIANSDVDLHVGALMSGGHILINGNSESYAGREMTGGLLEINGNVKEYCGSSYIGEWQGISGGKIIIKGNCGKQLGDCMRNGNIYIQGNCDILAGVHMTGGYIHIQGNLSKWPGGQMKNGIIVVEGEIEELLEGFQLKEIITNPKINNKYHFGKYLIFSGDIGSNGKGEIWTNYKNNKKLI